MTAARPALSAEIAAAQTEPTIEGPETLGTIPEAMEANELIWGVS